MHTKCHNSDKKQASYEEGLVASKPLSDSQVGVRWLVGSSTEQEASKAMKKCWVCCSMTDALPAVSFFGSSLK